jgi:hypothetical protein
MGKNHLLLLLLLLLLLPLQVLAVILSAAKDLEELPQPISLHPFCLRSPLVLLSLPNHLTGSQPESPNSSKPN